MPKDFLQGASLTPTFEALMVKFGGKIGTLYQMLKNAFKKHPLQNRTNVQIKGGGSKAFWTMLKKTALFLQEGIPNSPHLSCTSLLHDIYFPVQHLHQIQDWNILMKSRTCQVPRDQFREERDSPVSPVRAVCDCVRIYFSFPRRLNSKTLLQWRSPLTFQCQVRMFCSN